MSVMWTVSRKYVLGAALVGVVAFGVTEARAQGPWTGPYIGLHAGYGWADTNIVNDTGTKLFPGSLDAKGWLAGAHLGLNVQLGSIVVGGEFSLSSTGIDGSKANCFPTSGDVIGCTKEDDWLLLAMGRLGFAFSGNVMAYGTAGWAVAGVTTNTPIAGLTPNVFRASAVHDGFAYGAGIEYRIPLVPCSGYGVGCGSSWTLGLEYLHVNLDEQTHTPSLFLPRHVEIGRAHV